MALASRPPAPVEVSLGPYLYRVSESLDRTSRILYGPPLPGVAQQSRLDQEQVLRQAQEDRLLYYTAIAASLDGWFRSLAQENARQAGVTENSSYPVDYQTNFRGDGAVELAWMNYSADGHHRSGKVHLSAIEIADQLATDRFAAGRYLAIIADRETPDQR